MVEFFYRIFLKHKSRLILLILHSPWLTFDSRVPPSALITGFPSAYNLFSVPVDTRHSCCVFDSVSSGVEVFRLIGNEDRVSPKLLFFFECTTSDLEIRVESFGMDGVVASWTPHPLVVPHVSLS